MREQYTILATRWWTPHTKTIGIVAIECFPDEWKAYIEVAPGVNEQDDAQHVAAWGAGLTPEEARGFFPHLPIEKYKRDEVNRTVESEET